MGRVGYGLVLTLAVAGSAGAQEVPEPPPVPTIDNAGSMSSSMTSSGSSHTETTSESNSVSVSVGVAPPPPPPVYRPARSADPTAGLAGEWKLSLPDGSSSCGVTLKPNKAGELYDTWVRAGCPEGFFTASKWRPVRGGVEITDLFGKTLGSFHQVGRSRMEGTQTSDNSPVILTR
jgi:hypothetical protein